MSDYDTAMRSSLVSTFAEAIGIPENDVSLTITASSVRLLFEIAVFDAEAAASVSSQLEASLRTAADASSALGVEVEDTPVIIVLTPPLPPMPPSPSSYLSTPLPPMPVKVNETDDSVETEADDALTITLGGEWYVLAGGLCATAFALAFGAYSRAKVKLRFTSILSIFIASGDAFTDIAFTAQQLHKMKSLFDHVSAFLLLFFLVVPSACAGYQIILALRLPLLNAEKLQDLSAFYAFVLLIAITNIEVLRILPWREGTANFDGLPDKGLMVRVWLTVMVLEDLPQFCLQLMLTLRSDTGLLAPLSLMFTMTAVIWRALRKAIYLVPVATTSQTVLSLNSQRESAGVGSTVDTLTQRPLTSTWSWPKRSQTRSGSGCCRHESATAPATTVDAKLAVQADLAKPQYDSVHTHSAVLEQHVATKMAHVHGKVPRAGITTTHLTPWATLATPRRVDGRQTAATPTVPELSDTRQSQLQALSRIETELARSDSESDVRI